MAAAQAAKETTPGRLTLQHVTEHHRALAHASLLNGTVSPLLLPDYVVAENKG